MSVLSAEVRGGRFSAYLQQVFDLPVCRMIAAVPAPSADSKMIDARHTCFCSAFRSLITRSSRSRSGSEASNLIPVRMILNRTAMRCWESQKLTHVQGGIH
jgi:hypothetical protein